MLTDGDLDEELKESIRREYNAIQFTDALKINRKKLYRPVMEAMKEFPQISETMIQQADPYLTEKEGRLAVKFARLDRWGYHIDKVIIWILIAMSVLLLALSGVLFVVLQIIKKWTGVSYFSPTLKD